MKIIFKQGNQYFDIYNIYNDENEKIGMFEHHCRGVKNEYYVGWKLNNDSMNTGTTKSFNKKEDAIFYSIRELYKGEPNEN